MSELQYFLNMRPAELQDMANSMKEAYSKTGQLEVWESAINLANKDFDSVSKHEFNALVMEHCVDRGIYETFLHNEKLGSQAATKVLESKRKQRQETLTKWRKN